MGKYLIKSGYALCLVLLSVVAGEITTRVEDQLRYGADFFSTPDFDYDLFQLDERGKRQGKPHGHHKKWRLNQFGFRSPEIEIERTPNIKRVMIIGSSETFGAYESSGKDYPAQLNTRLNRDGNYEIINTSLPGMTLNSARQLYADRFARFQPDVVVIYVSPLFYLNFSTETGKLVSSKPTDKAVAAQPSAEPKFKLRIVEKLKDVIDKPDFWQRQIDAQVLAEKRAALGQHGVFTQVPQDLLELFMSDLEQLLRAIKTSGAMPIIVTHAIRSHSPPTTQDLIELQSFLHHTPRATPEILLEFEATVRNKMLALAKDKHVTVVDLAKELNGQRAAFGDTVHFTDVGATTAAKMIAEAILKLPSPSEQPKE